MNHFLYKIIRIIYSIFKQQKCPNQTDLEDYVKGRIPRQSDKADALVGHLGQCEKCRDKMKEIAVY